MRIRRAALGKGYLVGTNWHPTRCAMTRRRAPRHLINRLLSPEARRGRPGTL